MKNISDKDIRPGSATCPSCKSDRWNSAIMIVMEGTTNARGTFTATANTAAKRSGGLKESLLSDRWFSWDYPTEADIGLNTSTGLVQEVKRFMVEYGPSVQMPSPPPKPILTTSISNMPKEIRENPRLAQALPEPIPSGMVEKPVRRKEPGKSIVRSKLPRFLIVVVPSMVSMIGVNAFFGNDFLAELSLYIILPLIMIIASFNALIPKVKMADDEDGLKDRENWPDTLEHYAMDRERFQEEAERFRNRYEESEKILSEYKKFREEATIYEQLLAEYENKRISVLKSRELLWERTRLCMRCGTAYLGSG